MATIFQELLGHECLQSLSLDRKKFLGIELADTIEPDSELDI
jgi:hypothetical protein